jgi:hypothetical protein
MQKMKERYRIHQIIAAHPGTRAVVEEQGEDGPERKLEPVLLLALVEDLDTRGHRFVAPLDDYGNGLFMYNENSRFLEVLAPGEQPKPWMMDTNT